MTRPPSDHDRHRVHDLEPGAIAEHDERQQRHAIADAVIRIGASRSRAPRMTSSGPCVCALVLAPAAGSASTSAIPLRAAIANTARRPASAPSENVPPAIRPASSPPTSASGSDRNASAARRQLPNAACRSRKMPIAAASPKPSRRQAWPRAGRVADHLGVVLEREREASGSGRLTSILDVAEAAPAHVRGDVDAPRAGVALDRLRRRPDAHVGDWPEAHVAAARRVDQQPADVGQAARATRASPRTTTSKTFCCSNRLPTWMPDSSVAACAAHVAGLDAVALAVGEVDLDRHGRLLGERSTRGSTTPSTPDSSCFIRRPAAAGRRGPRRRRARGAAAGRAGQHVEVGARAGGVRGLPVVERADVADPLLLVGQHACG